MISTSQLPALVGRTSPTTIRIFHLISSGGVYGAEKMVVSLSQALERLGCECVLGIFANQHRPDGHMADLARAEGLTFETIPCRGKADPGALSQIRQCLDKHDIDIIHAHGYKADVYAYAAARKRSIALVATSHFWTQRTPLLRIWASIDQMTLRRFDHVVAVSDEIASFLEQRNTSHGGISTIDNGVDLDQFAEAKATLREEYKLGDRLVIGTVARLVKQKGLNYFLLAARRVADACPEAVFVIVGDGPLREELTQLTATLGLNDRVIFAGERNNMPEVYASFDIFVLASLKEGMPIALLEALASCLPVVATKVAAVPKLVIDHQTGLLVEPGDADALATAIGTLITDQALRRRVAKNGHEHVRQQYSSASMAKQYRAVYEQVLAGRRQPSRYDT